MNRFYKVLYKAQSLLVSHKKKRWNRAFLKACKTGNLNRIQNLCKPEFRSVADIHADHDFGFRLACDRGHLEVVKFLTTSTELVASGHSFVDIHAHSSRVFHWACENGQLDIIKFLTTSPELLAAGHSFIDIHAHRDLGFRESCRYGHVDVVKFLTNSTDLLKSGHSFVDIHVHSSIGLHWACQNKHWNVVEYLIFDLKIEKTQAVESLILEHPQLQGYFNAREEHQQLTHIIHEHTQPNDDPKSLTQKSPPRI